MRGLRAHGASLGLSRASPDNIAIVDFTNAPDDWVGVRQSVAVVMEYKTAVSVIRQTEEMQRRDDYHPSSGDHPSNRGAVWVDMSRDSGAALLKKVIPSLDDRAQIAQLAAVTGVPFSMWVMSDPSGAPIRIVHIKWTVVLLGDILSSQRAFFEKVFKWADVRIADPSIEDVDGVLGGGEFDLKHARSASAVWQNVVLSRRLVQYLGTDAYQPNMVIKRLLPGLALCWNAWKGADDARTGMQNKVQPTGGDAKGGAGAQGVVCLRIMSNVVLNMYDVFQFAQSRDLLEPVSRGGCGGNVQRFHKYGNINTCITWMNLLCTCDCYLPSSHPLL